MSIDLSTLHIAEIGLLHRAEFGFTFLNPHLLLIARSLAARGLLSLAEGSVTVESGTQLTTAHRCRATPAVVEALRTAQRELAQRLTS